jgi:DNA repair exonuclease SbcCD ATPase subunit
VSGHDHRGEYAEDRHDHDLDYAEKYHRHYDDESTARGLREDLGRAEERIRELENELHGAQAKITDLDALQERIEAEFRRVWALIGEDGAQ